MPGPVPKDPALRQRRNKVSTGARLDPNARRKPASLTQQMMPGGKVHRLTRRWWNTIWRSPMAPRWLEADIEVLYLVAILRNEFYLKPSTTLAAEIRQQEMRVGLDVMARRRLDWRIEGPRQADPPPAPLEEKAAQVPADDGVDPRRVLRVVS